MRDPGKPFVRRCRRRRMREYGAGLHGDIEATYQARPGLEDARD